MECLHYVSAIDNLRDSIDLVRSQEQQIHIMYSGGKKNPDLLLFYPKKEQTRVKRPNKSQKTVNLYLKYNMYK